MLRWVEELRKLCRNFTRLILLLFLLKTPKNSVNMCECILKGVWESFSATYLNSNHKISNICKNKTIIGFKTLFELLQKCFLDLTPLSRVASHPYLFFLFLYILSSSSSSSLFKVDPSIGFFFHVEKIKHCVYIYIHTYIMYV